MGHKGKDKTGVILLNLGGPDSLNAVRPFLYNLFSDREILRLGPSFMQKPAAWFLSGLRSKKTEEMYRLIGGKSPIKDITMEQASALEKALNAEVEKIRSLEDEKSSASQPLNFLTSSFKVYVGMRYWHPFIDETLKDMFKDGIRHIIVLSLYPHYSRATTGSSIAEFKRVVERLTVHASRFTVNYIEQWYDFPSYTDCLADFISSGISEFKGDNFEILYSAHSLPESFISQGDPYLEHIKATVAAVNASLVTRYSLHVKWHLSFQSKSGPVRWLQPSTDEIIIDLAKTGCKNLFVVPISFVSDHVETLYEIDILYKDLAMKHGMNLIRCQSMNATEKFIDVLKELVIREIQISTDKKNAD